MDRYAQATIAGFINKTRQVFNDAIDRQLLSANPFRKVRGGTQVNNDRQHFVSRDDIEKVIAVAPNAEWKLLIALARYGGLRIPSEAASMRIADIDFAAGRITVRSPKTEGQNKPRRVLPLFPELVPHLRAVIDAAPAERVQLPPFVTAGYNPPHADGAAHQACRSEAVASRVAQSSR